MKKELIFGVLIIFLIGLTSATPYILFVNPTPANGAETTGSSVVINSTIENISTLNEFIFQWQGTNYSLYDEDLVLMLNLNNNSALGENTTHVYDSSRGQHNGTITGTILSSNGKYQRGLSIASDGEYVNLNDHEDFRGENFTISFWYNKSEINFGSFEMGSKGAYILLDSGEIYFWGTNQFGIAGDGTSVTNRETPVKVTGGYNFKTLARTDYPTNLYMCGLLHNGSALCWGRNNQGQLGIGNTTQMNSPYYVLGGYNFSLLSLGEDHMCGLLQNGSALCWGNGGSGELGIGNTSDMYTPQYVLGGYNFDSISCGDSNTCGLLSNGSALCWGRNGEGQLGIGNTTNMNTPQYVLGGYNFKFIKNSNDFACGILHNGSALCWGQNNDGALGIGNTTDMSFPFYVSGGYNFSTFDVHYHGVCGLLHNGSSLCWGWNDYGQLGIGNSSDMYIPTYVSGGYVFSSIRMGTHSVLATSTSEKIYSWGGNNNGELGKSNKTQLINIPTLFKGGNITSSNFSQISSGNSYSCGLLHNGSAFCWGYNYGGTLGNGNAASTEDFQYVLGGHNFSEIYTGDLITCGLLHNDSALCWGSNLYASLGNGTTGGDSSVPVFVSGGYEFKKVYPGRYSSCGILHNGSALCWGFNNQGQLGNGNTTNMNTPQYVLGGYNFSEIACGFYSTCSLLQNGSALCWGYNAFGQLGIGNTTTMHTPQYVLGGYEFKQITYIGASVCGVLHNGSALCWGYNNQGQLGIGNTTNMYAPIYVLGDFNFSSVSNGNSFVCGIINNGSLSCWGGNLNGELGTGDYDQLETPKIILSGQQFSSIHSGLTHVFGVLTDGRIVSWGRNNYGQLGFLVFNSKIPTQGIYKGKLIGKGPSSFEIGTTLQGDLRFFINKGFRDLYLETGYNQITLSKQGTLTRIYLNGELNKSFNSFAFEYLTDTSDLIIGDNIRGQVDEVMMWNRTLSDSEVSKVYESSLYQKNHTAWEFYSVQTLSSVGTYTYKLFAKDGTGWFSVLRRIVKIATGGDDDSSGGGGYTSPSYTIKEEKLQEGHTRWLREKNKIKLEFAGQGSKTLEVLSIRENSAKVEINNIETTIYNGTTEKIDVDNDGFYDLEVSLLEVSSSGAGRMMFKEIYEEISSESQKDVEEEVKEEKESPELGEETEKKVNFWSYWEFYVAGIVVILGVVFWFLFSRKK